MNTACETCNEPLTAGRLSKRFCSERCRKRSYGVECSVCGGYVYGATPSRLLPDSMCATCRVQHRHDTRRWTRDAIIAAIRNWEAKYGFPPAARHWLDRKMLPRGAYPSVDVVQREFGSWSTAIAAAGFEPLRPGHKRGKVAT